MSESSRSSASSQVVVSSFPAATLAAAAAAGQGSCAMTRGKEDEAATADVVVLVRFVELDQVF